MAMKSNLDAALAQAAMAAQTQGKKKMPPPAPTKKPGKKAPPMPLGGGAGMPTPPMGTDSLS